jgi:hypothetical protein
MFAGASTGSIMSGLLTVPDVEYNTKHPNEKKRAKYFINETINLYRKNGSQLFKFNVLSTGMTVVVGTIITLVLGSLIYAICRHYLENKKQFNKLKRAWMKAEGLYFKYEDKER